MNYNLGDGDNIERISETDSEPKPSRKSSKRGRRSTKKSKKKSSLASRTSKKKKPSKKSRKNSTIKSRSKSGLATEDVKSLHLTLEEYNNIHNNGVEPALFGLQNTM